MSQTVIGLFRNMSEAQAAQGELLAQGYAANDVRVFSNEHGTSGYESGSTSGHTSSGTGGTGIMDSIKHFFGSMTGADESDHQYYAQGVSRGGVLVAVTTQDNNRADDAIDILDQCGATEIEDGTGATASTGTSTSTRTAGTVGATTTVGGGTLATGNREALAEDDVVGGRRAGVTGEAIPIVEEDLQVGKREVRRGGVRVYSHLVSTPVEESINLREEHARVQRTPVNRPASEADFQAFKEGTIEVVETAEEPVVSKQARVVEEVSVGKEVTERTETIRDSVRHTEVDVEEVTPEIGRSTTAGR
jgi:uncharacterized protein (TIGR02271 family)